MRMCCGPYDKVINCVGSFIDLVKALLLSMISMFSYASDSFPKCSKRNSKEFFVNNLGLCLEVILLRGLPLSLVKARLKSFFVPKTLLI